MAEMMTSVATINIENKENVQHSNNRIEFRSNARIRPFIASDKNNFMRKHFLLGDNVVEDDPVVLQKGSTQSSNLNFIDRMDTLILKPKMNVHGRNFSAEKGEEDGKTDSFLFDAVLGPDCKQSDVYNNVARPMVDDLMSSQSCNRHHVLMSFGISNSGKTYTLLGTGKGIEDELGSGFSDRKRAKRSNAKRVTKNVRKCSLGSEDGIVPRIMSDFFRRCKAVKTGNFQEEAEDSFPLTLGLSMVHIYHNKITDLLTPLSTDTENDGKSKYMKITYNTETKSFETNPRPFKIECSCLSRALSNFSSGLKGLETKATNLNCHGSSRGHTIISLTFRNKKITIVDMAGIERVKKSDVMGLALKESISINESVGAVLNVLRALKQTGNKPNTVIPYRRCPLTMLLQPIFSGYESINSVYMNENERPAQSAQSAQSEDIHCMKTIITMLVSVYPGQKDYAEKRALLHQIESVRGLSIPAVLKRSGNIHRISKRKMHVDSVEIHSNGHLQSPQTAIGEKCGMSDKAKNCRIKKTSPLRKFSAVVNSNTRRFRSPSLKKRITTDNSSPSFHEQQERRYFLKELEKENIQLKTRVNDLIQENKLLLDKNADMKLISVKNRETNREGIVKDLRKQSRESVSVLQQKSGDEHELLPFLLQTHMEEVRSCARSNVVRAENPFVLDIPNNFILPGSSQPNLKIVVKEDVTK